MTKEVAQQIASLLNTRNELSVLYTVDKILADKNNYVFIQEQNNIIACAESKKVQWYQWEICHVSVHEKQERKGYGLKILKLAEKKAREGNARILQATIRSNNEGSIGLFTSNYYKQVNTFYNLRTDNIVNVYQKNISSKED